MCGQNATEEAERKIKEENEDKLRREREQIKELYDDPMGPYLYPGPGDDD